jgi:predicted RND superfamily exporter protein
LIVQIYELITNYNTKGLVRIKKNSRLVLIGMTLVSVFFLFQIPKIGFDYDFEAFFAEDDETKFLNSHRQRFETDNDFVFVALENKAGVFNQAFLEKTNRFIEELSKDTMIESIQSLSIMEDFVKTPLSPTVFKRPYINITDPSKYAADSARIFQRPELSGLFIRSDAKALMVYIKHSPNMSKANCDILKENLTNLLNKYAFDDYKYAGRAIGLGYYIEVMQYETLFFIGLSFILIMVFLWFIYRSLWGILVPLAIVSTSMLWTVGFMSSVGQPINLVLTTLPSIIFVVAMSDVIHLISRYFDELRAGRERIDAVRIAYKEVGFATFLTSFTTAIGFATLMMVNMGPVVDFGLYTALGVMIAFFLAYTMLPAILILTNPPKSVKSNSHERSWYPFLHASLRWIFRHYKKIAFGSVVVIVVGVIGTLKVQSDYFLLEDLKESSSLRQDYKYFDEEFMGLKPFEMSVELKDKNKSIYDYEVLTELNKIDSFLLTDYDLKQCASVIQILKIANRTEHGGIPEYYTFPGERDATSFIKQFEKFDRDGLLSLFVDSTKTFARFSSSSGDEGRYATNKKNVRFEEFFKTEVDTNLISYRLTGTGHLLDRNMGSLSNNLTQGLFLAVIIIALLMGFLYRSFKVMIIALIPNVIPLIMLAAILGFFGIQLKVSTAIIFTISFGIAVDDTIHFMSKLRLELNKGQSLLYAIKRTYISTGKAIILTSLILCSGFLLLIFSDFLGTFYVGVLISLTLFFALLADLLLLPVLLLLFYKVPAKEKLIAPAPETTDPTESSNG